MYYKRDKKNLHGHCDFDECLLEVLPDNGKDEGKGIKLKSS